MAESLLLFTFLLITALTSLPHLSISDTVSPPLPSPPSQPPSYPETTTTTITTLPLTTTSSPFSTLPSILTSLGYPSLSMTASSTPPPPFLGPITLFAPDDPSLLTCPTCSLPLLLHEHSLPGLYPSDYLSRLPFATKLETLLPGHCLTLTSTPNSTRLFVSGADVTSPDLYVSPSLIIHGIQGFLSHLSPFSCSASSSTSLLLHHPATPSSSSSSLTRMMLADAMIRLRTSGYSILALAMRVKFPELVSLNNMTIFAVDDVAIFHGGHAYVHSVRFHVLPNVLLRYSDMEALPAGTVLPTLEIGESLTVTSGGGGGLVAPMRINYVRVKFPDMLYNMKLVVHGLSSPFPRLSHAIPTVTAREVGNFVGETVSHKDAGSPQSPAVHDNNDHLRSDYADYVHHGL